MYTLVRNRKDSNETEDKVKEREYILFIFVSSFNQDIKKKRELKSSGKEV